MQVIQQSYHAASGTPGEIATVNVFMCVYEDVCECVCVFQCVCVRMRICTCVRICVNMCVKMCMCGMRA